MPARIGRQAEMGHVCMHVLGYAPTDVRVMREAVALARGGWCVSVVDLDEKGTGQAEETVGGIRIVHSRVPWPFSSRHMPWVLQKVGRMLGAGWRLFGQRADIYHAHDITALPFSYLTARWHRRPLVYDAHELPLVDPNVTSRPLLHGISVRLLRALTPYCTAIITVSPQIAREFHARYGGPMPTLVRNMLPYASASHHNKLRERLGCPPNTRIALYQGGLQENRALDVVVRAAKYLAPGNLIVLMGSGDHQPQIEQLIAQEGVGDTVRLLPPVPYADLLAWTASADLGLILYRQSYSPNVKYCLPNKLFEYLMAGLPVLCSHLEAVADIIQTYDVGQVAPSLEPEALGAVINDMLSDRARLATWGAHAREAAKSHLCWEVEQERVVDLYRNNFTAALTAARCL
jgi:glycosyltransferase involved in cell wall biosynthesis